VQPDCPYSVGAVYMVYVVPSLGWQYGIYHRYLIRYTYRKYFLGCCLGILISTSYVRSRVHTRGCKYFYTLTTPTTLILRTYQARRYVVKQRSPHIPSGERRID